MRAANDPKGSKRSSRNHTTSNEPRAPLPTATSIALLVHPDNRSTAERTALQEAAGKLGLQLPILQAGSDDDLNQAFASLTRLGVSGLVIGQDAFFIARPKQIAALALHHSVPTIYQFRDFAVAGGLMSYGGEFTDTYHQSGIYAGRILKGEKPADLPVQQVTNVRLGPLLMTRSGPYQTPGSVTGASTQSWKRLRLSVRNSRPSAFNEGLHAVKKCSEILIRLSFERQCAGYACIGLSVKPYSHFLSFNYRVKKYPLVRQNDIPH